MDLSDFHTSEQMNEVDKKSITLPLISWKELQQGALIGNGSFGDVYKGYWKDREVAIKMLQMKTLPSHFSLEFTNEAQIMWQCQKQNILTLYGVCIEPGHCAMILEYMPNGSLYQWLRICNTITDTLRWQIAIDIARGLMELHKRNVLHRDLKSNNILLDKDRSAKISDFGLAKIRLESSGTSTNRTSGNTGAIRWLAPELLKLKPIATRESDMYSYGMVLWELLTSQIPYGDTDESTIRSCVKEGERETIPSNCPSLWQRIITACWDSNPSLRPTAAQVVVDLEEAQPKNSVTTISKSWHFDKTLKLESVLLNDKKYKLISAGKEDYNKVLEYYQHHPVPGYDIKEIEIIYNPIMNRKFHLTMSELQNRSGNPAFSPSWSMDGTHIQRQWRYEINNRFESLTSSYVDNDYPAVKLMPCWHGTDNKLLDSIFTTGYANLATTDGGFFGKGLYSTHEAEYANRVYSNGALLVNWVMMYSAYPVIAGDMSKLKGKGNFYNYDAHIVPVRPVSSNPYEVNYLPCEPGEIPTYTEIVVFDRSQCMPRYLVRLQTNLPREINSIDLSTQTYTTALLFSKEINGKLSSNIIRLLRNLEQEELQIRNNLQVIFEKRYQEDNASIIKKFKEEIKKKQDEELHIRQQEALRVQQQVETLRQAQQQIEMLKAQQQAEALRVQQQTEALRQAQQQAETLRRIQAQQAEAFWIQQQAGVCHIQSTTSRNAGSRRSRGEQIADYYANHNMTQAEVARRFGVSRSTVSRHYNNYYE